jgi:hypothetical protein
VFPLPEGMVATPAAHMVELKDAIKRVLAEREGAAE